jgi:predicted regulator of amino acid metabolism with ACT domain
MHAHSRGYASAGSCLDVIGAILREVTQELAERDTTKRECTSHNTRVCSNSYLVVIGELYLPLPSQELP